MKTRVDFYIISDNNPQTEDVVACRLAEKALKQGYKILILGQNSKQLHQLDEKLWTFKEDSFIPHEIINVDSSVHEHLNIALSTDASLNEKANLLINLSGQVPANLNRFERIAEIVPAKNKNDIKVVHDLKPTVKNNASFKPIISKLFKLDKNFINLKQSKHE